MATPPGDAARPQAHAHVGAFIDLGTNSVRLTVVEFRGRLSTRTLTTQKETVRLGEGEFRERTALQPAAMDRAVEVCARFAGLARAYGAAEVVTVATAAVREAENRDTFVRRLRDEAGLHARVVSGPEEARLVFLGVVGSECPRGRGACSRRGHRRRQHGVLRRRAGSRARRGP